MAKKVELKELASAFGMKIGELSEYLGYTRQGLYSMNDGTTGICTRRYYSMLKLLKFKSDSIYEDEVAQAKKRQQEREKLIQQMCDNVSAINVVERV